MLWLEKIGRQGLEAIANASAFVRVSCFFLVWIGCWLPIAIPLAIWLDWQPLHPLQTTQKLYAIVSLYVIAPILIWGGINGTKKSWSSYGIELNNKTETLVSLPIGIVLAISGLAIAFSLEQALDWLDWHLESGEKLLDLAIPILFLALFIAAIEELVFRGFIQTELEQEYGTLRAAMITSSIFALSHLIWDWENTLPELPGLWLLGMVLTQARLSNNGNLGLACGLHAGWIWGLTCLDSASLLAYTGQGSVWFTGWGDNPLAGISGIFCLLLTAGAIQLISNSSIAKFKPY